MNGLARLARYLVVLSIALGSISAQADRLRVAVASNFRPVMTELAPGFEAGTGHELSISYGSTGKHFAQIINGAPFDLFLAADVERPARLEAEGYAIAGSRTTYAIGRVVLWSPVEGLFEDGEPILQRGDFRFLAIANPEIAPYGRAAEQVMRRLGVWHSLQSRTVRGESIGQAFAHVQSGNAELGFVAASQLAGSRAFNSGSVWVVPEALYDPIEQQAVLLKDSRPGRDFLEFLRGELAAEVIRRHGYEPP